MAIAVLPGVKSALVRIGGLLPARWVLGAVVVVAGLGLAGWQTLQLERARSALAVEVAKHGETRALLAAQGAAVEVLRAQDAALTAKAADAEKRAEEAARAAAGRVRVIRETPKPATCEAAIDFLVLEAAGGLK